MGVAVGVAVGVLGWSMALADRRRSAAVAARLPAAMWWCLSRRHHMQLVPRAGSCSGTAMQQAVGSFALHSVYTFCAHMSLYQAVSGFMWDRD